MANIWKQQWKTVSDLQLVRAHLISPKLRSNLESLTLLNCDTAPQDCDRPHRARIEERACLRKNYLPGWKSDLCKICNCKIWPYESHSIKATGNISSCLCPPLFQLCLHHFAVIECKWNFCSVVNWVEVDFSMYPFLLCFVFTRTLNFWKSPLQTTQKNYTTKHEPNVYFSRPHFSGPRKGWLVPSQQFTEPTISHKVCGRIANKYLLNTVLDTLYTFSYVVT